MNEPQWTEVFGGEQADGSWVLDGREFFHLAYPVSPPRDDPKDGEDKKPPLSTKETMQATVKWWRENMQPRYAGLLDATLREKEGENA